MKGHGTPASYARGCRCFPCRIAESHYNRGVRAELAAGNGRTRDAGRARRHLQQLAAAGLGKRTVAAITGLDVRTLYMIRSGRVRSIFRNTEERILGVEIAVDITRLRATCRVESGATRKRIARLLEEGFTKKELARRLGYTAPALQLAGRPSILVRNAMAVAKLYRQVMAI